MQILTLSQKCGQYIRGTSNPLTMRYGTGEARSSSDVDGVLWHLPSRVSVDIGITHRSISVVIESPAMTALTESEEKYFAEGGEP